MRKKSVASHVMKRDNVFYYVRHVPKDLIDHYSVKRLCFSLKTKCESSANRSSRSITQRLDDYWYGVRFSKLDVPINNLIASKQNNTEVSSKVVDALELYLRLKGRDRDKVFHRTARRNIKYVIKAIGNKNIKDISSSDGAKFRDWLLNKGLSINTVKRIFSSVRSIINIAISEEGLDCINGFSRTYFPKDIKPNVRKPIPIDVIKQIQQICYEKDDDLRWLVALLSDTGMRLGEAVGLLKSDINLNSDIPYVNIRPHPWRSLKTIGSERKIPLVGASLWASKRIVDASDSQFAFPRYTNHSFSNANHASAALNKWIKEQLTDSYVIHGFRHSMRDRLRAVECPSDIVDRIGGWLTAGVGQTYGKGYPLTVLFKWLNQCFMNASG